MEGIEESCGGRPIALEGKTMALQYQGKNLLPSVHDAAQSSGSGCLTAMLI
jgi:hypothetical protein